MKVSFGGYASYAIDRSDRLWAWDGNQSGHLGTGGTPVVAARAIMVGIRLTQISSTAQNVAGLRGSRLRS